jgi:hypothetical protein
LAVISRDGIYKTVVVLLYHRRYGRQQVLGIGLMAGVVPEPLDTLINSTLKSVEFSVQAVTPRFISRTILSLCSVNVESTLDPGRINNNSGQLTEHMVPMSGNVCS